MRDHTHEEPNRLANLILESSPYPNFCCPSPTKTRFPLLPSQLPAVIQMRINALCANIARILAPEILPSSVFLNVFILESQYVHLHLVRKVSPKCSGKLHRGRQVDKAIVCVKTTQRQSFWEG